MPLESPAASLRPLESNQKARRHRVSSVCRPTEGAAAQDRCIPQLSQASEWTSFFADGFLISGFLFLNVEIRPVLIELRTSA